MIKAIASTVILLCLLSTAAASAQSPMGCETSSTSTFIESQNPGVERILLPIIVGPSEGAFGSRWETELAVHSEAGGLRALSVVYRGCVLSACPSEPVVIDRGSTRTFRQGIEGTEGSQPGALLYAMGDEADLFFFSLHIRDQSRSTTSAGTEIPVLRERELYSGNVVLLNIPFRDGFRNLLRIYNPFPSGGDAPVVRVRVISDDGRILMERSVLVKASQHNDVPNLPAYPGFAQVSDFADLQSRLSFEETARIEIEPLTPGLKFWAFVSVTNNETQHVTTITPQ